MYVCVCACVCVCDIVNYPKFVTVAKKNAVKILLISFNELYR